MHSTPHEILHPGGYSKVGGRKVVKVVEVVKVGKVDKMAENHHNRYIRITFGNNIDHMVWEKVFLTCLSRFLSLGSPV